MNTFSTALVFAGATQAVAGNWIIAGALAFVGGSLSLFSLLTRETNDEQA